MRLDAARGAMFIFSFFFLSRHLGFFSFEQNLGPSFKRIPLRHPITIILHYPLSYPPRQSTHLRSLFLPLLLLLLSSSDDEFE